MAAEETKSQQVMARVTPTTEKALKRIAQEMDRSISWVIDDLIVKFIEAREGTKKKSRS